MDTDLSWVQFVTFVLHGFLDNREKSRFVGILRRLAMAANHLLATLNPN
jgi:hypothetical protein